MSDQPRKSHRLLRTGRKLPKRQRLVEQAIETDPNATLMVPGAFSSNERYFFVVNGKGADAAEAVFSFLLEACWARKTFESGLLNFEDCLIADGNRNYFAKLAGELRNGTGCYWLLFAAENISLSPRILEMKGLKPHVIKKLESIIKESTT
jgi:hypothetical protein